MEDEAFFGYMWSVHPDEQREIGARIAEARRHGGLTQVELASQLGVTVRTIQNYESGVAVPYRHLRAIESLGHKRPGWILEGGDSDLFATISALESAMAHQYEVMQEHLREMREHMEHLRAQREAGATRRGPQGE